MRALVLTAFLSASFSLGFLPQADAENSLSPLMITWGQATADQFQGYLKQGQKDLLQLRSQLREAQNHPIPSAEFCGENPDSSLCFFKRDIPLMHQQLRLMIALSLNRDSSAFNLENFSAIGNRWMTLSPGSPIDDRFEPLTNEEIMQAQNELERVWDGLPELGQNGIIEDYIDSLLFKIRQLDQNPALQEQLKRTFRQFEASRLLKTPRARIEAASRIHDAGWLAYKKTRWAEIQKNLNENIWRIIEQFRFMRYLNVAKLTPEAIDQALAQSFADNQKLYARVETAKTDLVGQDHKKARKKLDWLLSDERFAQAVLLEKPELYEVANVYFNRLNRRSKTKQLVIGAALVAPIVLLYPPAGVALGMVGKSILLGGSAAAGSVLFVENVKEYKKLYQLYLARITPSEDIGPLATGQELRSIRHEILLSPMALTLSLGLGRLGTLKNLK